MTPNKYLTDGIPTMDRLQKGKATSIANSVVASAYFLFRVYCFSCVAIGLDRFQILPFSKLGCGVC
jgi:hypothetical protein